MRGWRGSGMATPQRVMVDERRGPTGRGSDVGSTERRGGPMFERVAVVNRGEPAMRFIRAAREWGREHALPLVSIALHTAAERNALFARKADEAVTIGPRHKGPANP